MGKHQHTRAAARPSSKDLRVLFSEAQRRGWSVTGGGQRHYQMRCPNPCRCAQTLSASTGSRYTAARIRSYLNRHTCWNGDQTP